MPLARAMAYACLTVLKWMLVILAVLLLIGFLVQFLRTGAGPAEPVQAWSALGVSLLLAGLCHLGARRAMRTD